eukprot:6177787-Pleurochrysis_carterae.AAC.1
MAQRSRKQRGKPGKRLTRSAPAISLVVEIALHQDDQLALCQALVPVVPAKMQWIISCIVAARATMFPPRTFHLLAAARLRRALFDTKEGTETRANMTKVAAAKSPTGK